MHQGPHINLCDPWTSASLGLETGLLLMQALVLLSEERRAPISQSQSLIFRSLHLPLLTLLSADQVHCPNPYSSSQILFLHLMYSHLVPATN